jgi:hypothetical protein
MDENKTFFFILCMPTKKGTKESFYANSKKKNWAEKNSLHNTKKYKQVREKDYKNCIPKNDNSICGYFFKRALDFMLICGRSGSRATWFYCIILGWKKTKNKPAKNLPY